MKTEKSGFNRIGATKQSLFCGFTQTLFLFPLLNLSQCLLIPKRDIVGINDGVTLSSRILNPIKTWT